MTSGERSATTSAAGEHRDVAQLSAFGRFLTLLSDAIDRGTTFLAVLASWSMAANSGWPGNGTVAREAIRRVSEGRSPDLVMGAQSARKNGALTIAIVNDLTSPCPKPALSLRANASGSSVGP